MNRVVSYCQRRTRLHGKSCLASCTLLTRRSTSIFKWACHAGCEAYKQDWLIASVTIRIFINKVATAGLNRMYVLLCVPYSRDVIK